MFLSDSDAFGVEVLVDGSKIKWNYSEKETCVGDNTIVLRDKNGALIVLRNCLRQVHEITSRKLEEQEVIEPVEYKRLACA